MFEEDETKSTTDYLPFGLTKELMPEVAIRFLVTSTKPASGFDEILIRGTGQVELRACAGGEMPPAVCNGRVEPLLVFRLMQLLGAEGMEGWDEVYRSPNREYVGKLMQVMLRAEPVKQVSLCVDEFPEFSRAFGAIKMIASITAPEVLKGGFFQRI